MQKEIYISIDIEADGPIPGPYSMLQFGAAAFELGNVKPLTTFKSNLDLLKDATQDSDTMQWWAKQGDAYENTRINTEHPAISMKKFVFWIKTLPGKPVIIGYPVTYDFMFLYWYTMKFGVSPGERCPFGFHGLDLKTLAWAKLGGTFKSIGKRSMPKDWFIDAPKHTHDGLDDAIGQGVMFINMMNYGLFIVKNPNVREP